MFIRRITWLFIAVLTIFFFIQAVFPPFGSVLTNLSESTRRTIGLTAAIAFGVGFLLRRIKWVQHIDTWIHEFGHAVTATFFGGVPKSIKLNSDSSGVTHFKPGKRIGPFRAVLISAAGPMASSITFFVAMVFAERGQASNVMLVSSFIVLLVLLTTMRSMFGWLVGLLVLIGLVLITSTASGWLAGPSYQVIQGAFLAAFTGVGSGVALRYSLKAVRTKNPYSDEQRVASVIRLPKSLVAIGLVAANLAFIVAVFQLFQVPELIVEAVTNLLGNFT